MGWVFSYASKWKEQSILAQWGFPGIVPPLTFWPFIVSLWTVAVSFRYAVLYYNERRRRKVLWEVESSAILSLVSSKVFFPCPAFLNGCVSFLMVLPCRLPSCLNMTASSSLSESEKWKPLLLSRVELFVTPWTVAHQFPLSVESSRQEFWSGLPVPSSGDLPNPGIKPGSLALPADSLPSEPRSELKTLMSFLFLQMETGGKLREWNTSEYYVSGEEMQWF